MPNKRINKELAKEDHSNLLAEEQVKKYTMIFPMLESMRDEMKVLSSKKQDGVLNSLKVKMLNRVIGTARELLVSEPTLEYLEELDEDMLPQNSDVVLILCQYIEALSQLRSKNQVYVNYNWVWKTQENPKPTIDNAKDY